MSEIMTGVVILGALLIGSASGWCAAYCRRHRNWALSVLVGAVYLAALTGIYFVEDGEFGFAPATLILSAVTVYILSDVKVGAAANK